MSEYVSIAQIVKARGVRGEAAAILLTDFPDRFDGLEKVHVEGPRGAFDEILEAYWFQKDRVILKFRGRNSPEEVQPLIWGYVQVPVEERVPPPEGWFYHSDLIGCRVDQEDRRLGEVIDVFTVGADVSNLVVENEAGKEWMIPLAGEFVRAIDLEAKRIQVSAPPELLELETPAGRHKGKRKQRREKKNRARERTLAAAKPEKA